MLINNLDINRKDRFKYVFSRLKSVRIYNIMPVWIEKINNKARYLLLLYLRGRSREFILRSRYTWLLINAYIFI